MRKNHKALFATAALVMASVVTSAQAPSFDIISIKRFTTGVWTPRAVPPGTFQRVATVGDVIQYAYDVTGFQVVGGPDWVRKDRFEIHAKAERPVSVADMKLLVRTLLEGRFKLAVRIEQRDMARAELRLARPDLPPQAGLRPCTKGPQTGGGSVPAPETDDAKPMPIPRDGFPLAARCVPIATLVREASRIIHLPVIDRTGLDGLWSYQFVFSIPRAAAPGPESFPKSSDTPLFSEAIQDALGLKLDRGHGPVEVVVIDSVEPPAEN